MLVDSARNLQAEVFRNVFGFVEAPAALTEDWVIPVFVPPDVLDGPPTVDIVAMQVNAREAKVHAAAKRPTDDIALGVGPKPGAEHGTDVELLVLCQDRNLKHSALVERIQAEARQEARVLYVGRARAGVAWHRDRCNPVPAGASVGHPAVTAGTLGCFARDDQTGRIGILSNNHVLAAVNRAKPGDEIWQPGLADGGTSGDTVAELTRFVPIDLTGLPNFVDCAFAELRPDARPHDRRSRMDSAAVQVGQFVSSPLSDLFPADRVLKTGRTTGYTQGEVVAIDVNNLNINFGNRRARFDSQIAVGSLTGLPFSRPGDSGSLVVNRSSEPAGLLFAGSQSGGPFNVGLTYVNPIDAVVSALGVSITV